MVNMRKMALAFVVAVLAWGTFWWPGQARSALPQNAGADLPAGERSLDFDTAVGVAIRQSPFFTKSALEIELKQLDESDSRWSFLPSVTLRTRYFVNRPDVAGLNAKSYAVDFLAEDYNPLQAYISLQVRKLLTRIAVLSHLQVISQGLHRLARGFLQLDNLNRLAAVQQEQVKLAEKSLAYAQELLKLERTALLEVKVAGQELELAQLEKKRLEEAQADLRQALKSFLGMKAEERLTFDLRPTRQQVLGDFDAAAASLEKARSQSYELKIENLKKELQARNITLAKTKLLPTIFFGVQTPDPLTLVDAHGYYFSVGLKLPVWDGLQRVRNISRQKTVLQQYHADQELKDLDFGDKWREARNHFRQAATDLKLSQAKEELTQLKARQGEIRYQAGEPLAVWLEGRKAHVEAQRQTTLKSLDHELAALAMRHLSGEVVSRYIHEPSIREK
jgi:outer membrane protein TolC